MHYPSTHRQNFGGSSPGGYSSRHRASPSTSPLLVGLFALLCACSDATGEEPGLAAPDTTAGPATATPGAQDSPGTQTDPTSTGATTSPTDDGSGSASTDDAADPGGGPDSTDGMPDSGDDGASGPDSPSAEQPTEPSDSSGPAVPSDANEQPGSPAPSDGAVDPTPTSPLDPDDPSSVAPGSGPLGLETTCDGVDDDANGVIDDVDIGADGVCDCLAIATLGLHGEWGGGDVTSGWLPSRLDSAVEHLGDAELTPELLAPYQVLLVRDVSTNNNPGLSYSSAEVDVLWNWVREGGGLMTLIGYSDPTEISNVNALLTPFSLSYGPDQIVPGQGSAAPISEWFEHPVTVGVSQVGADNGYPTLGQGTTLAIGDDFDFGKAVTIGDGHVLVWGDEWLTYESEWSDNSDYQVGRFWQNALRWLTRVNECQVPSN